MASADSGTATTARGLRVEHVTNSLAQIEAWVGAVRAALNGLEPDMPLPGSGMRPLFVAPIFVKKDCPPPPFKPAKKPKTKKKKK
jgi:hypothetical protein